MLARSTTYLFEPTPPAVPTSPRAIAVAAYFGIGSHVIPAPADRSPTIELKRRPACPIALPRAGELLFLSGASGSGKSSLLRAMRRRALRTTADQPTTAGRACFVLNLQRIPLPERPIVDLFPLDESFAPTLRRLARVGLAEVWTWLRPPSQLSEGQRWRLRLALAMHAVEQTDQPTVLVCDEFAALLDRVTAHVVASVLRRWIDSRADRLSAIVATSHDDVRIALDPDAIVDCDFGQLTLVRRRRRTDRQQHLATQPGDLTTRKRTSK